MGTIQNLALASFIEIYLFECCLYLILICCLCMIEFQEDDVLALLRDEETAEDKKIHTDISDEDLENDSKFSASYLEQECDRDR